MRKAIPFLILAAALAAAVFGSMQNAFTFRNVTLVAWNSGAAPEPPADPEFDISGATYYAVAEAGYTYTAEQTAQYSTRKYNTLAAAEAALPASPTTPLVINILGTWTAADTTAVTIDNPTTTAANYLLVRALGAARHTGKWTDTAYRLETVSGTSIIISNDYTQLKGLQVYQNHNANTSHGIDFRGREGILIESCIIKGNSAYARIQYGLYNDSYGTINAIRNTLIYDFVDTTYARGASLSSAFNESIEVSNLTIVNCGTGIHAGQDYRPKVFNTIVQNCANGFGGSLFNAASSNNVSDIAADAPGTNSFQATVAFVDPTVGDFHLSPTDSIVMGAGVDLSAEFTTDIDGETRTAWDIGADEYTRPTYLVEQDFEGLGVAPEWLDDGTADWDYTTTALVGAESLLLGDAGDYTTSPAFSATDIWAFFAVHWTTTPTGNINAFQLMDGATSVGYISIRTNNTLRVYSGAENASSVAFSADTTLYVWMHWVSGTSLTVYASTDPTDRGAAKITLGAGVYAGTCTNIRLQGAPLFAAVIIDKLRVSESEIGTMPD